MFGLILLACYSHTYAFRVKSSATVTKLVMIPPEDLGLPECPGSPAPVLPHRNISSASSAGIDSTRSTNASYFRRASREYDTAAWAFKPDGEVVTPNLAFLPILGLVLLVICSILKAYRWSRQNSRMKDRGDVPIWVDDDVNYAILQEGDKNYLPIDIRADGASLYDTITSFGMIGNGNIPSPSCGHHPYQDSVTSLKSLLLQRPEGNQYDSVKSYKAFLQRVTQDRDLAVEVKLLQNYPIKSKSAEHFVVVEEESSEKPESLTAKVLSALPLRKQINRIEKLVHPDKKKTRGRCASGDVVAGHRKRSASNPTSRRIARRAAASSLPSIQCHSSSDSEEDALKSLREDRRRMWAERKKMYRSVSGSKIARVSVVVGAGVGAAAAGNSLDPKRRRHYSADSARRVRRPFMSCHRQGMAELEGSILENGLKRLPKVNSIKRRGKLEEKLQNDSETSENPTSSHSSCNNSDAIESFSNEEDEDTKLCTHLSNMSDDQTIDDNVFLSVDTETTLSSSEVLNTPPVRALSSSRRMLARAKEDFLKEEPRPTFIDVNELGNSEQAREQAGSSESVENKHDNKSRNQDRREQNENGTSGFHPKHIISQDIDTGSWASLPKSCATRGPSTSGDSHHVAQSSVNAQGGVSTYLNNSSADSAGLSSTEAAQSQSPRKVQRFHVTFISSDISSLNSE
ncbi:hypothetical protein EGW08_023049 [Elysia chlorotica]|uniref:Uncharacterized protein n=1 Tax=Elysia chlorotica TaxID=188477 RepID=A0A3S1AV72_ELYCH|nr:hypothetical protein EGW08_023049 [Elysia chlorotica]